MKKDKEKKDKTKKKKDKHQSRKHGTYHGALEPQDLPAAKSVDRKHHKKDKKKHKSKKERRTEMIPSSSAAEFRIGLLNESGCQRYIEQVLISSASDQEEDIIGAPIGGANIIRQSAQKAVMGAGRKLYQLSSDNSDKEE